MCEQIKFQGAIPRIHLTEGELLEAEGKDAEAKEKYISAGTLFKNAGDKINAEYSIKQASNIDDRPLGEWIYNVMNGRYRAEMGPDGLTDSERRLDPFVGRKVRVVVNQGKWPGTATKEVMRITYEGIFCKSKYRKRLSELDKLMGHGKYDWWVEGKPVEGVNDSICGNWMIAPIFVESIVEL